MTGAILQVLFYSCNNITTSYSTDAIYQNGDCSWWRLLGSHSLPYLHSSSSTFSTFISFDCLWVSILGNSQTFFFFFFGYLLFCFFSFNLSCFCYFVSFPNSPQVSRLLLTGPDLGCPSETKFVSATSFSP